MHCDVAIIGGGPAGATVATLLKKYNPSLNICVFEADKFPRDHVGESQLPAVTKILDEMGAWDKIEAANFPIKIGASYRWGPIDDEEPWNFYFIPGGKFVDEPRPGKYQGQRARTTFQVDRAIYDKILLDHSLEMGCSVFEETKVAKVVRDGDRVDHLVVRAKDPTLLNGQEEEVVTAQYYVDASGTSGVIRETMGVSAQYPTALRNIAVWDYWQNAEWSEKIGVGGTVVQVRSFGWGWLWFIPLSPTRTSIGLITSAEYYKASGKTTKQLYDEAIAGESLISRLVANAECENILKATKDWSFISDRLVGENWFLAGDVCGFADPILAAGMSLAHVGARRVAYSILELMRGEHDPAWVKDEFDRIHRKHIGNHIRFADYWYSANGRFTDLMDYCTLIAKDSGLTLSPDEAFLWLGTGGFSEELSGVPFAGTYRVGAIKAITEKFSAQAATWAFKDNNVFELDLEGAVESVVALYEDGKLYRLPCYIKGDKTLPIHLFYKLIFEGLKKEKEILALAERVAYLARLEGMTIDTALRQSTLEALEVMVVEGWVKASYDPSVPMLTIPG